MEKFAGDQAAEHPAIRKPLPFLDESSDSGAPMGTGQRSWFRPPLQALARHFTEAYTELAGRHRLMAD
jgi:hypothetical protein